ncbi:MAG: hypothetical protein M3500_13440, partial [Actinomycetota bacterium]|nr:hypothetical protein [Actinomycetota bacterium]
PRTPHRANTGRGTHHHLKPPTNRSRGVNFQSAKGGQFWAGVDICYHAPTRDYVARRTTEGKTGREIKRCLTRYIARDLYRLLESGPIAA